MEYVILAVLAIVFLNMLRRGFLLLCGAYLNQGAGSYMLSMPNFFFNCLCRIEKIIGLALGKGYSSITLQQEADCLHSFLRSAPRLAIDIGANVGDYSAAIRKKTPGLEIHLFEPSVVNCEKLKSRFIEDHLVTIVPLALSNEAGTAVLFSDEPGSGMGSLTKRRLDHYELQFSTTEEVKTIRFEDYWIDHLSRRKIDLVKIDVEGHELSALNGFGEALQSITAIQFEFGGTDIDTRTFLQDFWYFFKSTGFEIYRLTPFGPLKIANYSEREESFLYANYVAVSKPTTA